LYSDVLDAFGSTRNVAVSGVPFASNDVYVYVYDDREGRAGSYAIGSTTYSVRGLSLASGAEGLANPLTDGSGYVLSSDNTLGAATDIDKGNDVKFGGLSGATFTLSMATIMGLGVLVGAMALRRRRNQLRHPLDKDFKADLVMGRLFFFLKAGRDNYP
jgi:hypothetical protein